MAIRLPSFGRSQQPTSAGPSLIEASAQQRPFLPATPSLGGHIAKLGQTLQVAEDKMKARNDAIIVAEQSANMRVAMARYASELEPDQFAHWGPLVAEEGRRLSARALSEAELRGATQDGLTSLTKNLSADVSSATITALKAARAQESSIVNARLKTLIDQAIEVNGREAMGSSTMRATYQDAEAAFAAAVEVIGSAAVAVHRQRLHSETEIAVAENMAKSDPHTFLATHEEVFRFLTNPEDFVNMANAAIDKLKPETARAVGNLWENISDEHADKFGIGSEYMLTIRREFEKDMEKAARILGPEEAENMLHDFYSTYEDRNMMVRAYDSPQAVLDGGMEQFEFTNNGLSILKAAQARLNSLESAANEGRSTKISHVTRAQQDVNAIGNSYTAHDTEVRQRYIEANQHLWSAIGAVRAEFGAEAVRAVEEKAHAEFVATIRQMSMLDDIGSASREDLSGIADEFRKEISEDLTPGMPAAKAARRAKIETAQAQRLEDLNDAELATDIFSGNRPYESGTDNSAADRSMKKAFWMVPMENDPAGRTVLQFTLDNLYSQDGSQLGEGFAIAFGMAEKTGHIPREVSDSIHRRLSSTDQGPQADRNRYNAAVAGFYLTEQHKPLIHMFPETTQVAIETFRNAVTTDISDYGKLIGGRNEARLTPRVAAIIDDLVIAAQNQGAAYIRDSYESIFDFGPNPVDWPDPENPDLENIAQIIANSVVRNKFWTSADLLYESAVRSGRYTDVDEINIKVAHALSQEYTVTRFLSKNRRLVHMSPDSPQFGHGDWAEVTEDLAEFMQETLAGSLIAGQDPVSFTSSISDKINNKYIRAHRLREKMKMEGVEVHFAGMMADGKPAWFVKWDGEFITHGDSLVLWRPHDRVSEIPPVARFLQQHVRVPVLDAMDGVSDLISEVYERATGAALPQRRIDEGAPLPDQSAVQGLAP